MQCGGRDRPGGRRKRGGRGRRELAFDGEQRSCGFVVPDDLPSDWASLLKRVHDVDALACPCGGRLRVMALITEPEVVAAILTSLHLPAAPPPIARARSPDDYDPAPD